MDECRSSLSKKSERSRRFGEAPRTRSRAGRAQEGSVLYKLRPEGYFIPNRYKVIFESSICIVTSPVNEGIKFVGHRHGNVYIVDLNDLSKINMQ